MNFIFLNFFFDMSVIYSLIREGEHLRQDFKFEISDARKIARSLVAFANTAGGRLLVGVKDNGRIAGVRSEEEFYMIESAATMYCMPAVPFRTKLHQVENKTVLEVNIDENHAVRPFRAKNESGSWDAYVRVKDQNILASPWLLKLWERMKNQSSVIIRYKEKEQQLLDLLSEQREIRIKDFVRFAHLPTREAEELLLDFVLLGIVDFRVEEDDTFFFISLKNSL